MPAHKRALKDKFESKTAVMHEIVEELKWQSNAKKVARGHSEVTTPAVVYRPAACGPVRV